MTDYADRQFDEQFALCGRYGGLFHVEVFGSPVTVTDQYSQLVLFAAASSAISTNFAAMALSSRSFSGPTFVPMS
jgi:hypothetical protein